MMPDSHLVIYLGALLNPQKYRASYSHGVARTMTGRYGGDFDDWVTIQQNIFTDWASYHADLNYSGQDGSADMREGEFRVTRALFRLGDIPEPDKKTIAALGHEIASQAPRTAPCFDDPAVRFLRQLAQAPRMHCTVTAYFKAAQTAAILASAYIAHQGFICVGPDTVSQYEMNAQYFQYLYKQSAHQNPIYLDKHADVLALAATTGFRTHSLTPQTLGDLPSDFTALFADK